LKLVTVATGGGAGVVIGDEILNLAGCRDVVERARLVPTTVRGILENGDCALDLIERIIDEIGASRSVAERLREARALSERFGVRLDAPITNPGLILSCGLNYHEHLREMNTPVPAAPTAFTKNAAQIIGPDASIVLPDSHPDMVDWEGEFCVVIGRPCHNVTADDALGYVAGVHARQRCIGARLGRTGICGDGDNGTDPRLGAESARQAISDLLSDGAGACDA
jgi:acylpyruvate hydrolase